MNTDGLSYEPVILFESLSWLGTLRKFYGCVVCLLMSVLLETSLGNIVIDLYTEDRPRCSLNFLKLCKINYYNGCLFHSVQRNLVAQTGDPTGTGRGGSSIFEHLYGEQARFFDCEISPKIYHKKRGLVSMVNNGSNQHGSQFFITLADDLDYLNTKHTVFGIVVSFFLCQRFCLGS